MTAAAPQRPAAEPGRAAVRLWARLSERVRERLARLTLLQRLLALEAAIFILLLAGTLLVANGYAEGMRRRIDGERLVLARSFAGHVDEIIEHSFHELRSAADVVARDDTPGSFDARQRELDFMASDELFSRGVVLVDGAGRVTATDGGHAALIGSSFAVPLAAAPERADGVRGWGFRLPTGPEAVLALAYPTRPASSAAGAAGTAGPRYVVGLLDAERSSLATLLGRAVEVGETAHAEVATPDGIALLSSELGHLLVSSDHPSFYARRLAEGLPNGTYRSAHAPDGNGKTEEDHIMAFVSLDSLPWVFALGGTASATYAPVRLLWLSVWGMVGVLGVLALTITVIGAGKLVAPVRTLSEAAHRVAAGELDTPITVTTGGEIGELGRSVETMRRFLYNWGVELDRRVGERTAEIAHRNRELSASTAVAQVAASTLEIGPMLREAAQQLEQTLDAAGVIVYIPERGGRPAERQASDGANALHGATTKTDCDACVAMDGGQLVVMRTVTNADGADGDTLPACVQAFLRSRPNAALLRVPIPLGDNGAGALCIFYREANWEGTPTPQPLRLLTSAIAMGVRNADLYEHLRQREGQARMLLGKVLNAQEEERARLARELHDDTGQALTGITFGLDALQRADPSRRDRQIEQIGLLRSIVGESIESLRRMILALRPPALDDLGLMAAIERYADQRVRSAGTVVEVRNELVAERLHRDSEVAIFRIMQEALNNVVRHSAATRVVISLERAEGELRAEVRDNGKGFVAHAGAWRVGAVGIEGMNERAEMLGGWLSVESSPGHGTIVRLVVPETLVLEQGQLA